MNARLRIFLSTCSILAASVGPMLATSAQEPIENTVVISTTVRPGFLVGGLERDSVLGPVDYSRTTDQYAYGHVDLCVRDETGKEKGWTASLHLRGDLHGVENPANKIDKNTVVLVMYNDAAPLPLPYNNTGDLEVFAALDQYSDPISTLHVADMSPDIGLPISSVTPVLWAHEGDGVGAYDIHYGVQAFIPAGLPADTYSGTLAATIGPRVSN